MWGAQVDKHHCSTSPSDFDLLPTFNTDYKSLILRTGRPQEATFVHWDGRAARHPVPSRIF